MRGIMLVGVICLAVSSAMPAVAQQNNSLPSSGTFKVHSGWKGIGEATKFGDNRIFGSGNFYGVTTPLGPDEGNWGPIWCWY